MNTIVIGLGMTIQEGQEIIVPSTTQVGAKVKIARHHLGIFGKPIAEGRCVMNMENDPNAPVTQTTGKKKASPWRHYRKIKIDRIY